MDTRDLRRVPIWRTVTIALAIALLAGVAGCSLLAPSQSADESKTGGAPAQDAQVGQAFPAAISPPLYSGSEEAAHGTEADLADAEGATRSGAATTEQLLVRTATTRLRVDDIEKTLGKIRDLTAEFKGQIDDLQVSTDGDTPIYRPMDGSEATYDSAPLSAYATIRVPSGQLAAFSKRVSALGTVLRESSNQTDVTQQHIDMSARLKNLRAEEVRYRQFLNSAKNVKEMLLVESELSRVRGEIEAMQSQLDYLNRQISYGTLTVELQKPAPVVRPTGTDWGFSEAITNGIQGAASALRSIITLVIALSPVLVLVLIAALFIRWIVRRQRRSRSRADSATSVDAGGTEDAFRDEG